MTDHIIPFPTSASNAIEASPANSANASKQDSPASPAGAPNTANVATPAFPQLVSVDLVSGGWVKKYLLTYKMPDGNLFQYESVSRKDTEAYRAELERTGQGKQSPDAVCIVPRTRDNKLVMIREFRYPINNWCIAFPAGLIESGEDLIGAVERELREETGYRLVRDEQGEASIRTYGQAGYSSAGMSEESVQIVYALVEPNQDAEPEPTEFIQVFELPLAEVPQFLKENKTPIGIRAQLILASLTPGPFAND